MSYKDDWLLTSMGRRIRIGVIVSYIRYPDTDQTELLLNDGSACAVETTPEEIDFLLGREEL